MQNLVANGVLGLYNVRKREIINDRSHLFEFSHQRKKDNGENRHGGKSMIGSLFLNLVV